MKKLQALLDAAKTESGKDAAVAAGLNADKVWCLNKFHFLLKFPSGATVLVCDLVGWSVGA